METSKIKILLLASRPKGTSTNLESDLQALQRAIDTTRTEDRFLVRTLWSPSTADFIDYMSSNKPEIVHFSGHGRQPSGDAGGSLVMTDASLDPAFLSEESFLALLRGLRNDRPKLLFLASCWSLGLARSATRFVQCAIGCPHTLQDAVASRFIHAFYSAIMTERSIQDAYEFGKAGMSESLNLDHRPLLEWAHDVDPAEMIFGRKAELGYTKVEQLIDLGLFTEAAFNADTALKANPADGQMMYILAFAKMNGRAPCNLQSLEEARAIETLLSNSLKISAARSQNGVANGSRWEGCAMLLWAWLKEDLASKLGFNFGTGLSIEALLAKAQEIQPTLSELQRIYRLMMPYATRGVVPSRVQELLNTAAIQ